MKVVYSQKDNRLLLPRHEAVEAVAPDCKIMQHTSGKEYLSVPNTRSVALLLRNHGFKAKAPIIYEYDWRDSTPFAAQRSTAAMLTMRPRAYVLNEMGTGKTLAALYALDYLRSKGEIRKSLVVAPLSTLTPVWEMEVFKYMPHLSTCVLHGTAAKRKQLFAEGKHDIYIINHDALYILYEEFIQDKTIDCIIVDELGSFRNATTNKWKDLRDIVEGRKFVWGLTGQPTPNAPTDAWAQMRLITPQRAPRFFSKFRKMTMQKVSQFTWVDKPDAMDIVFKKMQPAARFTRSQVIELPSITYTNRTVDMSSKQKKAYKEIRSLMKTMVEDQRITAANEAVAINKMLQIASGFIYTDGKAYDLGFDRRVQEVRNIIEQASRKVIVFCPFVFAVDGLVQQLDKFKIPTLKLYGKTPKSARNHIIREFQHGTESKALVAHPKTMSHGLTLTAANTIIWFAPTQSLETYEQANARIPRPGQTSKMLVVHLMAPGTIEAATYKRLERRIRMQGMLLDMFRDNTVQYG